MCKFIYIEEACVHTPKQATDFNIETYHTPALMYIEAALVNCYLWLVEEAYFKYL